MLIGRQRFSLYCDGGVILKNPSVIGGTWAWCFVCNYEMLSYGSGVITPEQMKTPTVTNNQTEMLALVRGLQHIPKEFTGIIYSDSQVTLGRAFRGFKWENIPQWLHDEFRHIARHIGILDYSRIGHELLAGHPTKKQLECGIGKHGLPVSKWNVWCDKKCGEEAQKYLNREMIP